MSDLALELSNLSVSFATADGYTDVVRDVSLHVGQGESLAIVGESGCGKSTMVQAIMGLIAAPVAVRVTGSAKLKGRELIGLSGQQLNGIRGSSVGMIFQDPMTSLNPTMSVGDQIAEVIVAHRGLSWRAARAHALALLDQMRVPDARTRMNQYPFELSGGMAQRVMIAISLACGPSVLIADEPTTALDVTIQDQVLTLIQGLQKDAGMAIVLITHDLAVVARMADRVSVMYAGQVVESGCTETIFDNPAHPYTVGLKEAIPQATATVRSRLAAMPGSPPDPSHLPIGCSFCDRCPVAMVVCQNRPPPLFAGGSGHDSRCWRWHPSAPVADAGLLERPT